MKLRLFTHSRFLPLLFVLALPGCAQQNTDTKIDAAQLPTTKIDATQLPSTNVDPEQLKTAMDDSAQYLVRATKPSGEFVYLDNLDPARKYKPVYNVLRHAGTMYSLAEYYRYKPDSEVKSALARSAKWLQTKYIKPVKDEKNLLAVWALPTDVSNGGPTEIKLGGVGLGLVGLLGTEKVIPGTTSLETLRQLGNTLLWMQNPDGSFYSKYDPARGGKQENWISLYYPGEAALALAMLAEHDPDPKWKARWINAAFRAVGYLAQIRKGAQNIPADHWVLIATARLWPLHPYSDQSISKADLVHHAVQICQVIIADPALRSNRTTPIATRLEGMNAALTFLPAEHQVLRDTMQKEVKQGVAFLLTTQAKDGEMKGGIPRSHAPVSSTPGGNAVTENETTENATAENAIASNTATEETPVDRRASEVRIDYVQHALSAWLEYARMNGIIKNATSQAK